MKILVTTDFSSNSKAAIQFAANFSKQTKGAELIFYSAVEMMQPASWNLSFYKTYAKEEKARLTKDLEKFVKSAIGTNKNVLLGCKYVIDFTQGTEKAIIEYAVKSKCQFICIATNGAGILRKLMGTHTSYLVNHSSVPVLAIPSKYKTKAIKKTTYVSDFENLIPELNKVSKLSGQLKCQTEALHYARMGTSHPDTINKIKLFSKPAYLGIKVNILETNIEYSLVDRLTKYIGKQHPDLIILFTRQKKGFFEQLFLPSKAAELTFSTKIPTLIYPKN
ncbi:universal stress protein [Sediminibacterium sp.]|uniref:universal stress protein n=1 Tax=Sediminibacterium sp. TaxID=1917865 RepID=UPI003F705AA9